MQKQSRELAIQKVVGIILAVASVVAIANNLLYFMSHEKSISDFLCYFTNITLLIGLPVFILSGVFDTVWLRYAQLLILYVHCLLSFSLTVNLVSGWCLLFIVCVLCDAYGFLSKFRILKIAGLCVGCLAVVIYKGIVSDGFASSLSGVVNGSLYMGLLTYLFFAVPRKVGFRNENPVSSDSVTSEDRVLHLRTWLKAMSDPHFSETEIQVLCLFLEYGGDLSNKEMAARLGCSLSSVKMALHRLSVKFGVQSRTALLKAMLDLR